MSRPGRPPSRRPANKDTLGEADEPISVAGDGDGDVGKLIRQLPPSEDLLEYYRNKTDQFQRRLLKLAETLDSYRDTVKDVAELEAALTARDAEIAQLQLAVSDMQVYVFQERDQVLRLHAENDRLKIQEVEDRRKIDVLLSLSGTTESSLTYFMREVDAGKLVKQKLPPQLQQFAKKLEKERRAESVSGAGDDWSTEADGAGVPDVAALQLEVGCLRAQLEERTRLAREERQALLDDRRVSGEERQAERSRRDQRLKDFNEKLRETQKLLYSTSRDLLRLHAETQEQERAWMAEKDQLLRERELLCSSLSERYPARCERAAQAELPAGAASGSTSARATAGSGPGPGLPAPPARASVAVMARGHFQTAYQKLRQRATELMYQLEDANTRAAQYREQCIRLERVVSDVHDAREHDRADFHDRLARMRDSLLGMKGRYDDLERRRKMEAEGFRSDIRILRNDVKTLERKLSKLTGQLFGGNELNANREVWSQMSRNLGNTAKILEEIRRAKQQIYELERELGQLWSSAPAAQR